MTASKSSMSDKAREIEKYYPEEETCLKPKFFASQKKNFWPNGPKELSVQPARENPSSPPIQKSIQKKNWMPNL